MKSATMLLAALALGCGTVQPTGGVAAIHTLSDGFPSEPYEYQLRPGRDGRCSRTTPPPTIILRGGGCWVNLGWSQADCEAAAKEGQLHVWDGTRCYYPILDPGSRREPVVRAEPNEEQR
jgi:hypothetical protein